MIRERTLAGLASARARGRKGGRKRLLDDKLQKTAFKMYDSKDYTIKEIATAVGIKESTLYLYLKRRKEGDS
jgi:DNA invertase Pin-like site-specific DNA recombinase